MHQPVLLQKVIENLRIKKDGLYIDATFGEGGHSLAILKRGGRVLAIDQDCQQIAQFKQILSDKKEEFKNLILIEGNFADIETIAKKNNFYPVDGILFDLGLSMRQLKFGKKGLSYKNRDEPLDMRLGRQTELTAADLVNKLSQKKLYEIFARYSEEINSLSIAKAIIEGRSLKKIKTVGELITLINKAIGRTDESVYRRIFQALRIAVNDELENLKKGLLGAMRLIKKDGRIVVITYHSIEDRIVKTFIKKYQLRLVTKKPIFAKDSLFFERSAKLRVISF